MKRRYRKQKHDTRELILQIEFEIKVNEINGASTCPMLKQKVQTNHFSVASGVGMGGGRSSALSPQCLGKL